jgi:signal transduction histidine kinase
LPATLNVVSSTVDGQARLVVASTGPIIEPCEATGLLEPFRRLHERTASDGVGLGLAIVAAIAAVHSGTVGASAGPGGGLEVVLAVPSTR